MVRQFMYRVTLKVLPNSDWADNLVALFKFLWRHRRWPGSRKTLNDHLYLIKTTNAIVEPLRLFVTDKEYVKLYVKATIGEKYNVPTIAVLRSPVEAHDYHYTNGCCIKPTHLTGKVEFCTERHTPDLAVIDSWFRTSQYRRTRERNYKYLVPKVIVEPILFHDLNLMDYKIFCVNGKPKLIQVDLDRRTRHTRKYFDCSWNDLPFSLLFPRAEATIGRPKNLESMLEVSGVLSNPFDLVRIDLYTNGTECFVGEITNCHGNTGDNFIPPSSERIVTDILYGSSSLLLN